jgi:hypothetical protein
VAKLSGGTRGDEHPRRFWGDEQPKPPGGELEEPASVAK